MKKEVQAEWKLETEKAMLMDLRFKDLRATAATFGVRKDKLEAIEDADDAKIAIVALIL